VSERSEKKSSAKNQLLWLQNCSLSAKARRGPLPLTASLCGQVLQTRRTARRQNLELQKCEEILSKLIKYRFSWPFR